MKNFLIKCPICGKEFEVSMTDEQYIKYIEGEENIQNIFPDWPADKREMLITGICGKCWDDTIKIDENEE